jgi:cytochrome c oxidase subunit I+III
MLAARRANRQDSTGRFLVLMATAIALACGAAGALVAGPWLTNLDPTIHVYPSTVWVLACWSAIHLLLGVVMQVYCVARRLAGRMTTRHDIDVENVVLYWHFAALTVAVTVAVIAGFPLVA